MSRQELVAVVAPIIDACIDEFEAKGGSGADAFSDFIVRQLKRLGFCRRITERVEHIGVHPQNREGAKLIAVVVQDLLKEIVNRGWLASKCMILACAKPSGIVKPKMLKTSSKIMFLVF